MIVFNIGLDEVCKNACRKSERRWWRDGDFTVYLYDINQPSSPTPFSSVLVSVSVFMAFQLYFIPYNSPDNSPFSHAVLPVLFLSA